MSILKSVAEQQARATTAAVDRYNATVRLAARAATDDAVELDPDDVIAAIADVGKTHADFEADVARVEQRIAWVDELSRVPEIAAELDDTEGELRESYERVRAEQRRHKQLVAEQAPRLAQLRDAKGAEPRLRKRLLETSDDRLKQRATELQERRRGILERLRVAQENLSINERAVVDWQKERARAAEVHRHHKKPHFAERVTKAERAIDKSKGLVADWKSKVDTAREELPDIERLEDELRERMLQP